jgi:hypothetical protein
MHFELNVVQLTMILYRTQNKQIKSSKILYD